MINKEMIEARLGVYKKDLQALQQQYILTEGAVKDCEYWLTVLEAKEKE